MAHKGMQMVSVWDLRRNLPAIRAGLKEGMRYVLLYRGKPVGELTPPSVEALDLVFTKKARSSAGAARIRRNVARRRRERLRKRRRSG